MSEQLTGRSATDLAALVRRHEVLATEVVGAHLELIERLEPELGAFVDVRSERALADAAAIDRRADIGSLPLAGVPVAVKDNIDVAGSPTRWGSAAVPGVPASEDDTSVMLLRRAGCIPIGKTKVPELTIWGVTEPRAFGPARNPWAPGRTPGGSTGGGGAAVASGMTPLALGTDGGGSLRIPAACCGVVGMKPGPGVVQPSPKLQGHWLGMTHLGPLAFSVADAAQALATLAGRSELADPQVPSSPLRIGVSRRPPDPFARLHPDAEAALVETAELLAELGHEVEESDPPYPPFVNLGWAARAFAGVAEDARRLDWDKLEPETRGVARFGRAAKRLGVAGSPARSTFARRAGRWLARFDLVITPVLSGPAVELGSWSHGGWLGKALGQSAWAWTTPWSLARVPCASIPARLSVEGLPIGIQLVAPLSGEKTILSIARQLELVRPWRRWRQAA